MNDGRPNAAASATTAVASAKPYSSPRPAQSWAAPQRYGGDRHTALARASPSTRGCARPARRAGRLPSRPEPQLAPAGTGHHLGVAPVCTDAMPRATGHTRPPSGAPRSGGDLFGYSVTLAASPGPRDRHAHAPNASGTRKRVRVLRDPVGRAQVLPVPFRRRHDSPGEGQLGGSCA